ncbi:MAG: molybdenum cofactor biosynthesis protein A [Candidatus Omnitrophica bacterium ADurb.Bin277]|nr:MAG: molybdenum cofactor biosynthesis protein A [Candidatus Omnitrophica bacterium ADurb.Bin277]
MGRADFKYIYGPVFSWRYGRSLGVDPVSASIKTCSFDCVYCQAGKTKILSDQRSLFVPIRELTEEIGKIPPVTLDQITFAGNGEPTLAVNLGEMIREMRKIRPEKIAVITNASLIDREDVRAELALADLVVAKLDAVTNTTFQNVNRAPSSVNLEKILEGIGSFRKVFAGKLAIQVMFVALNKGEAARIAERINVVAPDEIEVNTPLRASPAEPLSPVELGEITKIFRHICCGIPVKSVYEAERAASAPFCPASTERRRGREDHRPCPQKAGPGHCEDEEKKVK